MAAHCSHPPSAALIDAARGIVTCSVCGEVTSTQAYELDPAFNRDSRPAGGAMRQPGGYARPIRSTQLQQLPASQRPSIDVARRGMMVIARQLQISNDDVEIATGIFKLAVTTNAIGGARPAILAACLYMVCRRNHSPHTVIDFADATKQSPFTIIGYMKTIAAATHTTLPTIDPSYHLRRFAEQLALGDHVDEVALFALKILRAMRQDWINEGRRPLGPCAAALALACQLYGFPRSVDAVAGMVRLSAATIELRLREFSNTSAAKLTDIDEYVPTDESNPRAFERTRLQDKEYDRDNELRHITAMYYELVEEAKLSAAATEERCAKWRDFFERHCKVNNLPTPEEAKLDLKRLTPTEQLHQLGLKHTAPLTQDELEAAQHADKELAEFDHRRSASQTQASTQAVTLDEQAKFHELMAAAEVEDLGDLDLGDFDLADPFGLNAPPSTAAASATSNAPGRIGAAKDDFDDFSLDPADGADARALAASSGGAAIGGEADFHSPPSGDGRGGRRSGAGHHDGNDSDDDDEAAPKTLEEVNELYFSSENGWEVLYLEHGDGADDNGSDLDGYIIFDGEERARHSRLNLELHRDHWSRGAPRSMDELKRLRWSRVIGRKRRRSEITPFATAAEAVQHALRGKGAAQLDLANMEALLSDGGGALGASGGGGGGGGSGPGSDAGAMDDGPQDWEL